MVKCRKTVNSGRLQTDNNDSLFRLYCFEPPLRPFFGNILASNPSRKIPTRIAISVISMALFVITSPLLQS